MKNNLLLILLFLVTIPFTFSQEINQEYIFTKEAFIKIKTILNVENKTYVGGSIGSCRVGAVGIISHQNEYEFFSGVEPGYWDVDELELRTTDSIVIGSGNWYAGDDFTDPNDGPYVFGMSLDGGLLFEKHLYELGPDSLGIVNDFAVYLTHTNAGGIMIAFRNYIAELDNVGELINLTNYGFDNDFLNINRINANTLFAYTKRKLLLINDVGIQLDLVNSSTDILDVYSDSDNIYCLITNDIMVYNVVSGELTFSTNHLNSIENARGITGNSNSLFLYQKIFAEDIDDKIIQLNKSDLSIINGTDFLFDKEETRVLNILATENDLQIIGRESDFQPFLKSKPILDDLIFTDHDIEIVSITPLNSFDIIDSVPTVSGNIYFLTSSMNYEFVVKNNSATETVNSFSMTGLHSLVINCSYSVGFNHFDNLSILPGESMTFAEFAYFPSLTVYPPLYTTPTFNVKIFGPNHRFDMDLSNNEMIGNTFITSTNDLYSLIEEWNIYPNPVMNEFHLTASLKEIPSDMEIIIYNSVGQEVKKIIPEIMNAEIEEVISIQEFSNGLYFVSLKTNEGIETQSIVINN